MPEYYIDLAQSYMLVYTKLIVYLHCCFQFPTFQILYLFKRKYKTAYLKINFFVKLLQIIVFKIAILLNLNLNEIIRCS
jgi:hypothetical protein